MALPVVGLLLVAVNVTVLLVLATIAKALAKRDRHQADFSELKGVSHLSTGEAWHPTWVQG